MVEFYEVLTVGLYQLCFRKGADGAVTIALMDRHGDEVARDFLAGYEAEGLRSVIEMVDA